MRKLHRRPLTAKALDLLRQRTEMVLAAEDPVAEAQRLWKQRDNAAFQEIRTVLKAMAPGRERCMYCEDSGVTDIDHFRPKKEYPELAFTWINYIGACSHCNSNEKRDRFPLEKGEPLLIDPTQENDDPSNHLALAPSTGKLRGKTAKGSKSIEVFGLDRGSLEKGRRDVWVTLLELIPAYARYKQQGNVERTADVRNAVCQISFSCVLDYLIRVADSESAADVIPEECRIALQQCPEIREWASGED